jgi:hypothetical protein
MLMLFELMKARGAGELPSAAGDYLRTLSPQLPE